MKTDKGPQKISEVLKQKKSLQGAWGSKTPPTYEWQDLALRIIDDLGIPNFKRNAVFKVCKERPKNYILSCLNDTKELCQSGEKWKYFFKLIGQK